MPIRCLVPFALCGALLSPVSLAAAQAARPDTADPYRWLEEMNGERAMAWVNAENAKTAKVLEQDPRFPSIYRTALAMAQAKDRLAIPTFIGGEVYNFWQDSAHVRGIWRKTTLRSYRSASPVWTTVLDLDQLAKDEQANWVWMGADCVHPRQTRCLLSFSDGGEDAVTAREFDLVTRTFPRDGFVLPKGKQFVAWMGADTLLVAREWTAGEMTASGYPYVVKRLARGQSLAQAAEVFRGEKTDVLVYPRTFTERNGRRVSLLQRGLDFFAFELLLVDGTRARALAVPRRVTAEALVDGQLVVRLSEAWTTGTTTIRAGALAAFDSRRAMTTPNALAPVAVLEPGPREAIQAATDAGGRLLVSMSDNVRGRILSITRTPGGQWRRTRLPLPDNASTSIISTDDRSGQAFISVAGYLTPSSVWLANTTTGATVSIKSLPPRFDASRSVVEQFEATSTDGTRIPYFIVHPRTMKLDGSNPTILGAYGGFEVSLLPRYDDDAGKLWVEQGGVYVIANIRGGGEFGPAWHQAGLKTKRQIVFDDFAAVARDLIARRITSPARLGIEGGSNGGLLMGVQMTQHPELFGAVQIAVPLLDMLRFEQIAAGASWVGEYGSVANPEERAFLERISPQHNLRAGVKYPVPFVWTTTKDDRVGPQHARKFAAKMADLQLPYFFYEVIEGGHGSGANAEQRARTTALGYTYFMRQLMGDGKPIVP